MRKVPFLTLEKAQEIAAKVPTPFHIYDEAGIRSTARALSQAFAWNPGFREYFAVKATPNPYILQILHEEGCGCDCATYSELLLSEAAGITGREVMFSSNVTPEQDLRKAWQMGAYINLDDVTHVDFLERVCGVPDTVCCRYNPGGSFSLGNTIMDMPRDAKYGMTEDQMAGAFQCLAQKGARQFGIHALLASNAGSNEYYPELAAQKRAHTAFVERLVEIDLSELDDMDNNQQTYLLELIQFLLGWLSNHIIGMDKKIAVYMDEMKK